MDVANLAKEVAHLPSHDVMVEFLQDAKADMRKDVNMIERRCAHDIAIHNDLLLEMRTQLLELARHHATAEQKLSIALKFVDWFTEVKLKGSTFDRPV